MKNPYNVIRVRLEDIASSLRMPEMPDVYLLEEGSALAHLKNPNLSEEGLQTLRMWNTRRAFANHETSIEEALRQRVKNYDLDIYLENRVFIFYPRSKWSTVGAQILGLKKVRERETWRPFIETFLKSGLSQIDSIDANDIEEDLHSKEGEEQRPEDDSGITFGS